LWSPFGQPTQTIARATGAASAAAARVTRLPAGHPEGYLEAFANLYQSFATAIRGGKEIANGYPSVADGLSGMRFLRACVKSSKEGSWVAP
jgi:predicted dehydrogenase